MKLLDRVAIYFMTKAGIMEYEYSEEWDKYLNELIDTGEVEPHFDCVHKIGGVQVWTQNYPYAYGHAHGPVPTYRPSIKTMIRLRKHIGETPKKNHIKDVKLRNGIKDE